MHIVAQGERCTGIDVDDVYGSVDEIHRRVRVDEHALESERATEEPFFVRISSSQNLQCITCPLNPMQLL